MVYIVLGMHKSGTTLISQILHNSGINMGSFDQNVTYDKGNKYERLETLELNIKMLNIDHYKFSLDVTGTKKEINEVNSNLIQEATELTNRLNNEYKMWGFKDPRTCLIYPIWKKIIPDHKSIIIFRHPLELWKHYKPKYLKRKPYAFSLCWKSIKAWFIYNKELYDLIINGSISDYFIFEYAEFMERKELFAELSRFTETELKDSRNKSLYRSRKFNSSLFNMMCSIQKNFFSRDVYKLYEDLKTLSEIKIKEIQNS